MIKKKGFTLVEILAVTAITGILVVGTAIGVNRLWQNNRIDICESELRDFSNSLKSYFTDYGAIKINAEVVNEFFDGGFALRGKNLFSDFTITDDHNAAMTRGNAWAQIFRGSELVDTVELENRGNGIFRLDKRQMPDGEYTVWIKMYDKAGNESEHIFLQTLDNTVPTLRFIEPAENENATYYSRWMNVSKRIILDAADEIAGVKKYQAKLKKITAKELKNISAIKECFIYTGEPGETDLKIVSVKEIGIVILGKKTVFTGVPSKVVDEYNALLREREVCDG